MNTVHKSVLLKESVEGLDIKKGYVLVDGTFGGGGHSLYMLSNYPESKVVAIDRDKNALDNLCEDFHDYKDRIFLREGNFKDIKNILAEIGLEQVDGILLDLGISSDQLETSGRGFTFQKDEPLLMTMKTSPKKEDLTAREILNTWDEENIASIIYGYGEERYSRKIAAAVIKARAEKPIMTTFELVEIIRSSVPGPYKRRKIHFATKTFQALRIATNDELGSLKKILKEGFEALKKGGRISVISFHSLEDREVKRYFRKLKEEDIGKIITKKPIVPTLKETKENPRSRSAKLRIIEKI